MNKLKFTNIKIISLIEKKAIDIDLDSGTNIVIGDNDTGKSSLMKSIYYAFGTKIRWDNSWNAINPIPIIDFEYDNNKYTILRHGRRIVTFNKDNEVINHSTSITKEFTPFFSDFFNFKLELSTHNKTNEQATPAFCLMPFYIDQDKSWNKHWNSFEDLSQFYKWQDQIAEYHAGIRTSEYFELKTELQKLKLEKTDFENKTNIIESLYKSRVEKLEDIDLSVPMIEFKEDIESFIKELNEEKKKIDSLKEKLNDYYNTKYIIEEQIKLTENSYNELGKDYKFSLKKLSPDVECPTCGAVYDNSFIERFSIAKDQETCSELKQELDDQLTYTINKVDKINKELEEKIHNKTRIERILQTKKHQLTLRDIIEYKGKKNLIDILRDEKLEYNKEVGILDKKIRDTQKKLKRITSKERRERILTMYKHYMNKFTQKLNVLNLDPKNYQKIRASINLMGSDKPRALLAYYYSILKLIYENQEHNTFFPIVIDAPTKQQDQDIVNETAILKFLRDETPKDVQLIFAVTDLRDVKFNANMIELKNKLNLLSRNHYDKCLSKFKLLNQIDTEYTEKKYHF